MIEVHPISKLDCSINLPGSKYVANRAVILAALAQGKSKLTNVPINEDIEASLSCIEELGAVITIENGSIEIEGFGEKPAGGKMIDVGESGTLFRMILGVASLAEGETLIVGKGRLGDRPISPLIQSLNDLGIKCEMTTDKTVPLKVIGGTFIGGTTTISGNISSQFISSLLLTSPFAKKDVEIKINSPLISRTYVDLTIDLMAQFGVEVKRNGYESFHIKSGQRYTAQNLNISADWVSGSYFLAAEAILPGSITLGALDREEEAQFQSVLEKIKSTAQPIEIDMSDMPDVVQTAAIVAAFSQGRTKFTNIAHLKYKESDRLAWTAHELNKIGIEAHSGEDYLEVIGGSPKKATIDPMNDHRTAMSFAIIGLRVGMRISNPDCVNKSFPGFWDKLRELGAKVE